MGAIQCRALVGRQAELEAMTAALDRPYTRPVVFTGLPMSGIGTVDSRPLD